jgi:ATP-dependent DNA helicase RecG
MALESGYNAVLMAPTQILAEQLASNFRRWFGELGVETPLLTANTSAAGNGLSGGERPTLWIGTHALIENGFSATRLGLVIIDEQHRFGVAQREKLVRKGLYPHLLVMTATPIPRTLGLTLYGDLDISLLDQAPSGRGKIQTHLRAPDALPKVWAFIKRELSQGRQAYIVYPRVQDCDEDDVKSVTRELPRVAEALRPYAVGMLHGQLAADEKDRVMQQFRTGNIKALVATSVIEVGIDVPNASVMLIENAEQFGLAQLHQLRGRVGRGSHASHCILVGDQRTEAAKERLNVLAKTSDGFELAEADMKLRGPGDLVGRAQSGLPAFRFGDLIEDRVLVEMARDWVKRYLEKREREGVRG